LKKRIRKNVETVKTIIEIQKILEEQGKSLSLKDLKWLFPERPRSTTRWDNMRRWMDLKHEKAMRELRQRLEDKARAAQEQAAFFSRIHKRVILQCPRGHTFKILKKRFEEFLEDELVPCPICKHEEGAFALTSDYSYPKKNLKILGEEWWNPRGR